MRNKKKLRLSILLLADNQRGHANTVLDHISSFFKYSSNKFYIYNPRWLATNFLLDLNEFDAVVIHYSLPIIHIHYVALDLREKLRQYKGLKIQFIQDDYRQVNEYTEMMRYIGINVLFTPYPTDKIPLIYNEERLPEVAKYTNLTGYIPERYKKLEAPPIATRPIDVGYRGRDIPFWLGVLSQEKAWIGEKFLQFAASTQLKCDIAWKEQERIYGKDWDRFISSCKAMLGTESGASITDFDGSAESKTKEYLKAHPHADFWEVYENVLVPYEGNLVENTISPRVFECAAHRTALILFPGEYSGILQPWVHYIPLEKDFSNIEIVLAKLRDIQFLEKMTQRTYEDLVATGKYSFRTFIKAFDSVVMQHYFLQRVVEQYKIRYLAAYLESHARRVHIKYLHFILKDILQKLGLPRVLSISYFKQTAVAALSRMYYRILRFVVVTCLQNLLPASSYNALKNFYWRCKMKS
jgi:hypothetical protein